jgi:drug/metabolite transporter (DMT)-like permease
MAGVAAGVAVMVSGGLGTDRWIGDVFAVATVTSFAVFAVAVRAGRDAEMLPCVALGAAIASVVGATMAIATGEGLAVAPSDFFWCVMMGVIQMTGGMVLFVAGARYVPAAELALLSLTEVVMGPVWVWLVIREVPVEATFWGGAIVLAAIVVNATTGIRRRHPMPQV